MAKLFPRAAFITLVACSFAGLAASQITGADGRIIPQDQSAEDNIDELPAGNRVGDKVLLRTLDKITASTQDFTVAVGESLKFGTLTINARHCEVKPPEAIPETFAFLQIFEPPRLKEKERARLSEAPEPIKLFSGWMLASKPAVSALDHPVYDVWVVGCKGGQIN